MPQQTSAWTHGKPLASLGIVALGDRVRRILFALVQLTFAASIAAQQGSAPMQQPPGEALNLLDRVTAHYRDAEYLHVEATTLSTNRGPRRNASDTGVFSVRIAPGSRFRYSGEDSQGSSELVSDGTDEWRLMNSFPEYAKAPAGSFFTSRVLYGSDNSSLFKARDTLSLLTSLDAGIHAARFRPDETIFDNGKPIRCLVVEFSQADSDQRPSPGSEWHKTVWIDAGALRILKVETASSGHTYFPPVSPLHGPATENVHTTTVTLSDFAFQPGPDTFVFTPPPGVPEVASLPTGLIGPPLLDLRDKTAAQHIGKPLPDITLRDEQDRDVSLNRYRGHPLLIDVWATWCGPCLSEMPALGHIHTSTAATDLQIIGVDYDQHSADAAALLKRRGYDWPNFAHTAAFGKTFSGGIPLLVLVDAEGKIVYYHSGADDAKGLATAIAKLGPAYEGVRLD